MRLIVEYALGTIVLILSFIIIDFFYSLRFEVGKYSRDSMYGLLKKHSMIPESKDGEAVTKAQTSGA